MCGPRKFREVKLIASSRGVVVGSNKRYCLKNIDPYFLNTDIWSKSTSLK